MKKHRLMWGYLLALFALICCTAFLPFAAASADEPEGSAPVAVVEDVAEQADPASDGASEQGEGVTPVPDSAVEDESAEGDVVAVENADVPATDGEVAAEQSDPAADDVVPDVPATENNEEVVPDTDTDTPDELLPVLPVVDADDMVDIQEIVIEAEKPAARPKKTNSQDVTSPLATSSTPVTELTDELKEAIKDRMKFELLNLDGIAYREWQDSGGNLVSGNVWKVDIRDLNIAKSCIDKDGLHHLMHESTLECPDLFYVLTNTSVLFSISRVDSPSTWAYMYVFPAYAQGDIPAMQVKYEQGMQAALSWVPQGATELEKVHAIHDYLASTCRYDKTAAESSSKPADLIASGNISAYNAYGALVDREDGSRKAVCQGYSAAFCALMSKLGVASDYVTQESTYINSKGERETGRHGWNRVRIGGDWYNLDVTWDEGVPVKHANFLKSDGYWTTTGVDSRGFHARWDEDTPTGTNTQYDNKTNWVPYTGPATQTKIADFTISPSTTDLSVGESAQLNISSVSPTGASTYGATWTSSDPSIVAVDSTGKVFAGQTTGSAVITCTINGLSRSCTVYVGLSEWDISAASISDIPDQKYCSAYITPDFTVTNRGKQLTRDTDYTVTYAGNYNPGTATITVTGIGNYTGSVSTTFNISKLNAAEDFRFSGVKSMEYTGSAITLPAYDKTSNPTGFYVYYTAGGTNWRLLENSHYQVSYANNTNVDSIDGKATITITGIAPVCEGTTSITFSITPRTLQDAWVSNPLDQAYDGTAKKPSFSVTDSNLGTLKLNKDYTAAYTNNVEIGTATLTVTGIGNYTGTVTRAFQIAENVLTPVDPPTGETLTYNGSNQTGVAAADGYTLSGNTGKNAGSYTATATLDEGYVWPDGTTADKKIAWKINPVKVTVPTGKTLTYTGSEQTGVAAGSNYEISGTTKATAAGIYTATAVLKDKANYTWSDGKTADKEIAWKINPARVSVPTGKTLTYNGKNQTGVVLPAGCEALNQSNEGTKAGSFTARLKLKDSNYAWSDGTTENKDVAWKINPAKLTATYQSETLTYGANPKLAVNVTGFVNGESAKTAAGYTAPTVAKPSSIAVTGSPYTLTPKGGKADNYTFTYKSGKLTVNPAKVAIPAGKNFTFNGKEQTGVTGGANYTLSGTTKATKVGNYKATAKLKDAKNYTWSDGTTANKTISWKINPLLVSSIKVIGPNKATSLKLNPGQSSTLTATVSPSNATNKAVTWTSSNAGVVAVDKNTGKVTAKKAGTATITATAKDGSKKSGSFKITVNTPSISYRTHVQMEGWQGYVKDGKMSGTSGKAYRLEGINIKLTNVNGGITYRTHVQNIGWQGWKSNGAMSGTSGMAYRLEAIQIKLTGEISKYYDVYYRVHCQNIGWMGWAKNGEQSGTAGYAYRLEGIQIVVMPKGQKPGATVAGIKQATNECFRER